MIETAGPSVSAHSAGSGRPGGIAGTTAIVLVAVVTFVAGLLSAVTGNGFGAFFNAVYLVVTVYVALRVHVEDRLVTVIGPPIVYALVVFLAGFFDSEAPNKSVERVIENTFLNVSLGAPWLVSATVLAIVISLVRGRRAAVAAASRRRR